MNTPPPKARSKKPRISSSTSRTSQSTPKTEVSINVYDLLPAGRLSSILWTLGTSILHSGVVIRDREFAYGGHDQPNTSGVYYTKPQFVPPGATFRCTILHGFTFHNPKEIDAILHEVANSSSFSGPKYNLLTNNCNHFTSALCERLTGKPAPSWLNRAAGIGVAMPCMIPREWAAPPDYETADGELLEQEDNHDGQELEVDERTGMLEQDRQRWQSESRVLAPRVVDAGGRNIPAAERAPIPRSRT